MRFLSLLAGVVLVPSNVSAQMNHDMVDHAMSGEMDANMMKHMELTPVRAATRQDSARATRIASDLKRAIAKYQDSAVAIADGYRMFLPNIKAQRVYHFTNRALAIRSAFTFDATKPTSLLYKRDDDGKLKLVGAMYTMPRDASLEKLNERVPLGIARWHKHVNWCLPKQGEAARLLERKNGEMLFGPSGSIATKSECDAAKGEFYPTLFGWMVHVNVFEGGDLATIYGDDHSGGGHGGRSEVLRSPERDQ